MYGSSIQSVLTTQLCTTVVCTPVVCVCPCTHVYVTGMAVSDLKVSVTCSVEETGGKNC